MLLAFFPISENFFSVSEPSQRLAAPLLPSCMTFVVCSVKCGVTYVTKVTLSRGWIRMKTHLVCIMMF